MNKLIIAGGAVVAACGLIFFGMDTVHRNSMEHRLSTALNQRADTQAKDLTMNQPLLPKECKTVPSTFPWFFSPAVQCNDLINSKAKLHKVKKAEKKPEAVEKLDCTCKRKKD